MSIMKVDIIPCLVAQCVIVFGKLIISIYFNSDILLKASYKDSVSNFLFLRKEFYFSI
jgi:hypothetical protein